MRGRDGVTCWVEAEAVSMLSLDAEGADGCKGKIVEQLLCVVLYVLF